MTNSRNRSIPITLSLLMTGLMTALLLALFWAVAQAGSSSATAHTSNIALNPAAMASVDNDDIVVTGPATASLGQSVTYTAAFTVPQNGSTFYLTYQFPMGFSVSGHTPGANIVNKSVFWAQGVLGGTRIVTVTGQYNVGSCPVSGHSASLGDIYDPGSSLPTGSFTTTVSNVNCLQLPLILKPAPPSQR